MLAYFTKLHRIICAGEILQKTTCKQIVIFYLFYNFRNNIIISFISLSMIDNLVHLYTSKNYDKLNYLNAFRHHKCTYDSLYPKLYAFKYTCYCCGCDIHDIQRFITVLIKLKTDFFETSFNLWKERVLVRLTNCKQTYHKI